MEYLPYEEVRFVPQDLSQGLFLIECPWLKAQIKIEPGAQTFQDIMSSLKSLPIAYQLPRSEAFGIDTARIIREANLKSPQILALELGFQKPSFFESEWTWDSDAALSLASIPGTQTYDPLTLLTVARRYHYLDCADNKMQEIYSQILQLADLDEQKRCLATIVRQNHYVTELCEQTLAPALNISGSAQQDLRAFMKAERGHDKLLKQSLIALNASPDDCVVSQSAIALMALFQESAETNFMAFCFALDFLYPFSRLA